MSINSLEQRLGTILPTSAEMAGETVDVQRSESDNVGEPVVVAGGTTKVIAEVLEAGAKKAGTFVRETVGPTVQGAMGKVGEILDPMLEQGARAEAKPKIVESTQIAAPTVAPPAPAPASALKPKPKAPTPVKATEMMDAAAARQEGIDAGGPLVSPSPSDFQLQGGVEKGPISTLAFDGETMRSTIATSTERALADADYGTMTVRSMFQRAVNAGVPEKTAQRLLDGIPLDTTIGNNELTKTMAGMIKLHDDSASQLDDLFDKLSKGQLDDAGKLDLRQRMAFHDTVVKQLKGVQVDVARSMNAFKRVRDAGPGFKATDIRTILDEMGGDKALMEIAAAYMQEGISRKTKNELLEQGLGAKTRDVWIFSYMANLLNDIGTHAVNIGSGVLQLTAAPIERTVAIPFGMVRTKLPGAVQDRYYGEDIIAGVSGFWNGTVDAWIAASHTWKTGERLGLKSEQRVNPISAEMFSDVPVRVGNVVGAVADVATSVTAGMPLPVSPLAGSWADVGKEIWRTPDLANTWAGKFLDGLGYYQGLSLRAMSTADEFIGINAARYSLHEEAWRFGNKEYDKMVASGMSPDDAMKEAQALTKAFLSERPKQMQANVDKFRKQATLSDDFDRETKFGNAYWKLDHLMQVPILKAFNPFQKAISQLFVEGTARVPLLNMVSPRFHEEWAKGGRHRDLAMSRVAIGGSAAGIATVMALENKLTGSGPDSPQDRASLRAMGWQPLSYIKDSSEISPENLERINKVFDVSKGRGPFEGKVFISFGRYLPMSMPWAVGAEIGDMLKYHIPKPDEQDDPDSVFSAIVEMAQVGTLASAEQLIEHPTAQSFGEMLSIFQGKFNDKGEKFAAVADKLASQYSGFLFTGTPGVGVLNSTAMGHVSRLIDPEKRSTMADVADAPYGLRALYETRQKVLSKLAPFIELTKTDSGVPFNRDNLGRKQLAQNTYEIHGGNWVPFLNITTGKRSEADEALSLAQHGINEPPKTWNGVRLSATQYNRFKELYGQKIKLRPSEIGIGYALVDEPVNLEKAIPILMRSLDTEYEAANIPLNIGKKQKEIDKIVSIYREKAKERMIGKDSGDVLIPWYKVGSSYGLPDDKVEFEDLQKLIKRNRRHEEMYGR